MIPIPGIPPLLAPINKVQNTVVQLKADLDIYNGTQTAARVGRATSRVSNASVLANAKWGIYAKNKQLIVPDSIVSFDYRQDFHIADAPQEAGAFLSYNKVRAPYDTRLKMTKGGTSVERGAFLDAVELLASSLDLCDVITADKTFTNANVVHYEYAQNAQNGVGLLTVEVWLQQILITAERAFSKTTVLTQGTVQAKQSQVAPTVQ